MNDPVAPLASHFHVDLDEVFERLRAIDPKAYERGRNELDGAATWLGPFITHGVISTRDVADVVLENRTAKECEKLLNELGWREFFHRTWQLEGDAIFADLKTPQDNVRSEVPPTAVLEGTTGVDGIDVPIRHLVAEGTMHNHARLWTASTTTRFGRTWWHEPARWLHFHLIDGDLASNTLSWQWVAGTSRATPYVMNQDNVNKFAGTRQHGSWLDVSYEELESLHLPGAPVERRAPDYAGYDSRDTLLPQLPGRAVGDAHDAFEGGRGGPGGETVALHSIWNLDPRWRTDVERHVVFVDVDAVLDWPMSAKRWALIGHWAEVCGAEIVHGTVDELRAATDGSDVVRREYPACDGWPGTVEERPWLYPMPGMPFSSFTKFWKQVRGTQGL